MASPKSESSAQKLDFMMDQAAGIGNGDDTIITGTQGTTPKRARIGLSPKSSPLLGKRKLPEEPISMKQFDYLNNELMKKTVRIRQLENDLEAEKANVAKTELLLKDGMEELASAYKMLEHADHAVSTRDEHIKSLTMTLHDTNGRLQQSKLEIERLKEALENERQTLPLPSSEGHTDEEAGALEVKSLQQMAQVVAFEEAQRKIDDLEQKLEEVSKTRQMEVKLRVAMEDALIEQQHHYIMRLTQLENAKIQRQRRGWWAWCGWCM